MKSVKSPGGLTRGRGVNESMRTLWLKTLNECAAINMAMTKLTVLEDTMQDHTTTMNSTKQRDSSDLKTVVKFFKENSPFRFVDSNRFVSLV
jgi:hypothetical protein